MSQELLEILRCPSCVRDGPEAGLLDHTGDWLICRDCDRKYPIRDDIPVMLIEEGDRFRDVSRDELAEIPPPEERKPLSVAATPLVPSLDERQRMLLALIGLAVGVGLVVVLTMWLEGKRDE